MRGMLVLHIYSFCVVERLMAVITGLIITVLTDE